MASVDWNRYANEMLSRSDRMFNEVRAGHVDQLAYQNRLNRQLTRGSNQLSRKVLGGLANQGAFRSQQIADEFTQGLSQANQDLISRGLGNSTIAANIARGFTYDQAKAQTQNREAVAQNRAQFQTQLGQFGLGLRERGGERIGNYQSGQLDRLSNRSGVLFQGGLHGLDQQQSYDLSTRPSYGGGGGGGVSAGGGMANPFSAAASAERREWVANPESEPFIDLNAGMPGWQAPAPIYNSANVGPRRNVSQASVNPQSYGWEPADYSEYENPVAGYTYDWS